MNMEEMRRFLQVNMNYLCCCLLAALKIFIDVLMVMLGESCFAHHPLAPTFT